MFFVTAKPKLMFSIQIIFVDEDSNGEICRQCKKEIKGKKWTMMIDFDDPVNFPPSPLNYVICTLCKLEFEKED